jgi:hypothetical protein
VCVNRPGEEMTGTPGVARPVHMNTHKCTGKAKPNKVGPLGHQRVFPNHAEPFLPPSCLTGPENGCMSDGVCVCGVCVESIDPLGHTWPRGTPRLLRLGTLRVRVRNAGLHAHDGNAGSLHHTHTHNQQRAATACFGRDHRLQASQGTAITAPFNPLSAPLTHKTACLKSSERAPFCTEHVVYSVEQEPLHGK